MEELFAARIQMAFTLGFHIILACFGVGLPVLMLVAEGMFLRTGDPVYKTLAQRWSKAFAVLFAVGAVSGTVLSFELGLLWPKFMGTFGSVISLPFTLEGFAFFLEAIFVGIYIYGWNKLTPFAHFLSGVPIAIAGFASAWFVVTANSWMNSPQGFEWVDGKVVNPDPIVAMFNPTTWAQTTHMILAAYIVSGFCVASFYAWQLLWHGSPRRVSDSSHGSPRRALKPTDETPNAATSTRYNQIAMSIGLLLGCICMPFQMAAGDWSAKVVAKTQPIKFAAMESHFKTETGASLLIGGIPDMENQEVNYGIKIPKLLSFLAFADLDAEVRGLEEFPTDELPPVPVVHYAFQLMVGAGTLMMLYSLIVLIRWWLCRKSEPQALASGPDATVSGKALAAGQKVSGKALAAGSSQQVQAPAGSSQESSAFFKPRWFLWLTILMGPLAVIALETGWTVTEVGRQPWIVYGIMRTKDAVTDSPGINLIFFTTLFIYFILFVGSISILRFLARKPIEISN